MSDSDYSYLSTPETKRSPLATLKPGPEPTGRDRVFDTVYGWLGGTPDKRSTASALTNLFDVATLGMATGAYDGGKELAETGRPASLAMALMPGAKVAKSGLQAAEQGGSKLVSALAPQPVPHTVVPPGIKAYHGSPHDFDKFSLDKIGTGEGAQAYGHGLYLAESPAVAESYRTAGAAGNMPSTPYKAPSDVLARHAENLGQFAVSNPLLVKGFGTLDVKGRGDVLPMMRGLLDDPEVGKAVVRLLPVDVVDMLGGKKLSAEALLNNPSMLVDLLPANANDLVPSRVQAIDVLAPYVARAAAERPLIGSHSRSLLEKALAARGADKGDLHVSSNIPYPSKSGHMYEVRINAHPDDFLDWDKPLSQQSERVRKAAEGLPQTDFYRRVNGQSEVVPTAEREGDAFYNALAEKLGRPYDPAKPRVNEWLNHEAASKALRDAGIPGIRYLDGGSRSAGEGSHNYVAFDDSIVEILRKYGLVPPAAAGALAASNSDPAEAGQR